MIFFILETTLYDVITGNDDVTILENNDWWEHVCRDWEQKKLNMR